MGETYLLGIDIGTSGSSGVLVDDDLSIVASASMEHDFRVPQPGWLEHDAEEVWWNDFVQLTGELLETSDVDPADVEAVGVSAIFAAMQPVDENGDPLRPAILYGVDTRTTEEIAILQEAIGEREIYETCGNHLTFQSVGPKILWFERNEPELFERTDRIVDATGYVVSKLTGAYTIDNAIASYFHPMYDPEAQAWDEGMVEAVGVTTDLLPEPRWATEIAGEVTPAAAAETGLQAGTPVTVGTGDALASMVSVGTVDPGEAIFMYGTTGVIFTVLERNRAPEGLWSGPFVFEDTYHAGGGMATSGAIVRWFRDELADAERERADRENVDAYELLDDQARSVDPGSDGLVLLPYFSGERTPITDDRARGTLVGLTLQHTKGHLFRAVLEGVGYGFRHHVEAMHDVDIELADVRAIGGGARSPLWRQIVSDITGVSQDYVGDPLGSPLGDAFLAGYGVDVFEDVDRIEREIDVTGTTHPDPDTESVYDDYYRVYRDLYPQVRDSMHRLADLADERP